MSINQYKMPPEWAEHECTFIEMPVKSSLIFEENYDEVIAGYGEVIKAISQFEKVVVIANESDFDKAQELWGDFAEIRVIPHNDAWCRDNGPTFVYENGRLRGISWRFNAWGERFIPYDLDDAMAEKLLEIINVPCVKSPIILEGGSIHVDGEGTLLTTKECLLNKNRNPHLKQAQIEDEVKQKLGVSQIIWLNRGLFGDETDGHVDNVACFSDVGKVLIQTCKDETDPNFAISEENLAILRNAKDARGESLEIIEIEQPPTRFYEGERLTLSYLNFYIVNGGIILPIFGGDAERTDKMAIEVIAKAFPERKVVTIDGMKLIKEGGNVHCITQQCPKGV